MEGLTLNTTKPQRRALPNLFVDVEDYRHLDRKAKARGISLGELVKEALTPLLEQAEAGTGKPITLYVPDRTYATFLEFFGGDVNLAYASMVVHIEGGGDDFAHALKLAATGKYDDDGSNPD